MTPFKLGYFTSQQIDDFHIGAILVTDANSIPLEFKYTDPIRPSKIQKIIFGKVLNKYISEEVIKKTLLKDIKMQPALWLVPDPQLLGEDPIHNLPMVCLQGTRLPTLDGDSEYQRVKEREIILQPPTSTNPLKLTFYSPETDLQEKVLNILKTLLHRIDILEPFERLQQAVESLCQTSND